MKKFIVGCSPIKSTIFCGTHNDKTHLWGNDRKDVTDSAVGAVAQHLLQLDEQFHFEISGEKYVLKVDKDQQSKLVVWKDGTHKVIEDGITWEFEQDENWLVTIDI